MLQGVPERLKPVGVWVPGCIHKGTENINFVRLRGSGTKEYLGDVQTVRLIGWGGGELHAKKRRSQLENGEELTERADWEKI
jgi:hypothetical protein